MKGTDGNTYDSIVDLMNDLRFEIIEYTQREIDHKAANVSRFYELVRFRRKDEAYLPKTDSISVYIEVRGLKDFDIGEEGDVGTRLVIKLRLSDHGQDIEEKVIVRTVDVNDRILVKLRNEKWRKWSGLDWKTEKTGLINGKGAEFKIEPSDKGDVVREGQGKIMDNITRFVSDLYAEVER